MAAAQKAHGRLEPFGRIPLEKLRVKGSAQILAGCFEPSPFCGPSDISPIRRIGPFPQPAREHPGVVDLAEKLLGLSEDGQGSRRGLAEPLVQLGRIAKPSCTAPDVVERRGIESRAQPVHGVQEIAAFLFPHDADSKSCRRLVDGPTIEDLLQVPPQSGHVHVEEGLAHPPMSAPARGPQRAENGGDSVAPLFRFLGEQTQGDIEIAASSGGLPHFFQGLLGAQDSTAFRLSRAQRQENSQAPGHDSHLVNRLLLACHRRRKIFIEAPRSLLQGCEDRVGRRRRLGLSHGGSPRSGKTEPSMCAPRAAISMSRRNDTE